MKRVRQKGFSSDVTGYWYIMVRVHTLLFLTIAISCVMCTLPFNVCFPGNALCRVSAGTVRLAQRNVVDSLKDLFLLLLSFLMTVTAGSSCSFSCFWIARKATAELKSITLWNASALSVDWAKNWRLFLFLVPKYQTVCPLLDKRLDAFNVCECPANS